MMQPSPVSAVSESLIGQTVHIARHDVLPVSPARAAAPVSSRPSWRRACPAIRSATAAALVIGALTAVSIVVQAVALATAIDRSLLHHSALAAVRPELIAVALAVVARAVLTLLGEHWAQRTAESVVATLRGQLLRQVFSLGPGWLAGERPGELSLTATRGLRSLHTYFARYLPQAAMAAVVPLVLLGLGRHAGLALTGRRRGPGDRRPDRP